MVTLVKSRLLTQIFLYWHKLSNNNLFTYQLTYKNKTFAFADCIHTARIHNREIIPKQFMSNELETPGRASPFIALKIRLESTFAKAF